MQILLRIGTDASSPFFDTREVRRGVVPGTGLRMFPRAVQEARFAWMSGLIVTSGLTHRFGDVVALADVSLDVPSGRIGLVGANGAGKTTLIRILLGMLTPTRGSAQVMGLDVRHDTLALRSRVGYMPEDACLPAAQTAADFVAFAAELAGIPAADSRRRASEILFLVGLHEERFRYLGDFSTGMLQRVKLAQAIVHDPEVTFLDEPAAGLDPEGREHMLELIIRLGEFGISVVYSSHILDDVERTCDWVVMLDGGRLVRSGPIAAMGSEDAVTVEVLDDPQAFVRWLHERGAKADVAGRSVRVRFDGDPFNLVRDGLAATDTGVRRMGRRARTLEDAFIEDARPREAT
ncbi:putative ABC transporter ATP-binding protein YxlF [bacterium BMS3Bbin01]|nr:putative ABC transporter ATP-binding protein YxlF [bacterium BMS3Bbin01]